MESLAALRGFDPAFYAVAAAFLSCLLFWPFCLYKYMSFDAQQQEARGESLALEAIRRSGGEESVPLLVISKPAPEQPTLASVQSSVTPSGTVRLAPGSLPSFSAAPETKAGPPPALVAEQSAAPEHLLRMKSQFDSLSKEVQTLKSGLVEAEGRQEARFERLLDGIGELAREVQALGARQREAPSAPPPAAEASVTAAAAPKPAAAPAPAPAPATEPAKEPFPVIESGPTRRKGPVWPV